MVDRNEESTMHNWRIAFRNLLRRPAYAVTGILMLVLGIGSTTTIFSVVDTILLKPLPYPDPGRLVTVLESNPNKEVSLIAPGRLEDWNRMTRTFTALAGVYTENVTDTSGAEPVRLAGYRVSTRYFDVYGTKPLAGRTFAPNEEVLGGPLAAVISYGLWTRRYGSDPGVIGKRLILAGSGCTIVGVMPKDFARPAVDLWLPAQIAPSMMRIRQARYFSGMGRMKPGVTIRQARDDLTRVQGELGNQFPRTDKDWSANVADLKEARVGDSRRTLLIVFGAVALLLLIAISNIAGLTLAQLRRRASEMAIRSSVGASRRQLVATIMREMLMLAAAGALLGGLLSIWGVRAMAAALADFPRITELQVDWRSFAFAAIASLCAALLFGAIPALQSTRGNLAPLLAESSRSISGTRGRLQRWLVVAQLAVTVVLLSSAGLLLRSYYNLSHVDPGFNASNTVTFHVGAAWNEDRPMIGRLQMRIVEELERFPGVESAGITNFLPTTGASLRAQIQLEGMPGSLESASYTIGSRTISAGYLRSLKVPRLAGAWCPGLRPFESNGANKSLVNRQFVEQYAKGRNLIGRHTFYPGSTIPNAPRNEIVGIVGDAREDQLSMAPVPFVYDCASAGSWPDPEYVVRTHGDARALLRAVPQIVHGIDPARGLWLEDARHSD
jgi:predicted permease